MLHIWELYVLGFFFGVADAFAWPAATTLLPSLVKREQLVAANSVFQTTGQLTTIVAPAPAGLVIKALGTAWAFFIDAVSFLFIIAALWRLPDPPKVESAAKPPVWRSILDGIAYVRGDVPLRSLMLVAAMLNFCISGPMGVGLPYLVKTKFGSAAAYGLVISAMAAGGLIGALLAGIIKIKRRGLLLLGRVRDDQRRYRVNRPAWPPVVNRCGVAGAGLPVQAWPTCTLPRGSSNGLTPRCAAVSSAF